MGAGKRLRGAGERSCVVDEAAGLRAESAVRKWPQGAGERQLPCGQRAAGAMGKWCLARESSGICIKGWLVWCD